MPGSNGNGVRFSVDNRETSKGFGVEPESTIGKDSDSLQHERNGDIYIPSTGWVSPSQAYQNARSNGLTRRASRLYADQGKFLYGMSQDEPDFDYVMSVLRQQGLSRRAARQAMRNPEFWRNVRRKYGPQQQPQQQQQIGITVAPADAKEAELRDRMDAASRANEAAGNIYDPQRGWVKKETPTVQQPEVADDDLSSIATFGEAFRTARQRGLTQFRWKSTKSNPSGIFGTQLRQQNKPTTVTPARVPTQASTEATPPPPPNTVAASRRTTQASIPAIDSSLQGITRQPVAPVTVPTTQRYTPVSEAPPVVQESPTSQGSQKQQPQQRRSTTQQSTPNRTQATIARYQQQNTVGGGDGPIHNFIENTIIPGLKQFWNSRNSGGARPLTVGMGHTTAYQSGGKVGKDSEIQNAFIAYLIQQSNAQTQDELEQFVQSIGEDGLKSLYKKFVQSMQQGTQSAKNGAKLNYIKSLRGKCPEGYELGYFKEGGKVCAKCVEKREKEGALPFKPIQGEKGTKVVQDFKKDLKNKKDKITVPSKKPQKKEEGGTLDITIRQDLLDMFKCGGKMKQKDGGLVKKNNKIPIKEKFIDKDKCGSKMKKKKK